MSANVNSDAILAKLFGSVSRARIIELLISQKMACGGIINYLHFLQKEELS